MDNKDAALQVRTGLRNLGVHLDKKYGVTLLFLSSLAFLMVGTSLQAMFKNWSDMKKRFLSIEDVSVTVLEAGIMIDYGFLQSHQIALLLICEDRFFSYKSVELSTTKLEIIQESLKNEGKKIINSRNLGYILVYNMILSPVFKMLYLYLTEGLRETPIEHWHLPYEFIYPNIDVNLITYLTVYLIQVFYATRIILNICTIFYGSYVCSMNRVCTEMNLFIVSLEELKYMIRSKSTEVATGAKHEVLRNYFKELVQHHQAIIKKIGLLNEGVKMTTSVLVQFICFIICLSLFHLVESTDIIVKINYILMLMPTMGIHFVISYYGQSILNKVEDIRRALYDCCWLESPLWFKKDLITVMTFSNKDLGIRPFGLYIINFDHFSKILNVAYSYYNILRTFRN